MKSGVFYGIIPATCLFLSVMAGFREQKKKEVNYLPLGDSYTICTGAEAEQAWPTLLSRHLREHGVNCRLMDNPARNGYTTQNLIDMELPLCRELKPDFVTLLIGVNDWVRGVPKDKFRHNLSYLLNEIRQCLPENGRILLLTIPDFGVTPVGKMYAAGRDISGGIAEYNRIIYEEGAKRKLDVVDVFSLSKKMKEDSSLVASDQLHPSAKEYAVWEEAIFPVALKLLE